MKIITINKESPYLEDVIQLADANTSTLGFLPREAFLNHATNKRIFVALDDDESFLGYLLYGTNQRSLLAYITHLCIRQSHQGQGIAKALFNALKEATRHQFRGVRVRCRRDYQANTFWPKLGFYVLGDMPGRSKHQTTLTVWWFDYGYPTLFTYALEQQTQSKLKIVIDANILYELDEPPTPDNQLSHSLLADWLDVELCLTNEIHTEINRQDDQAKRKRAWAFATKFPTLPSPSDEVEKIYENLRDLFLPQRSESDESDLQQIAKTIAADVQFFITHDDNLLKKAEQVYERFGMSIIRPTDLIIHQDSLIRETEYQPSRLAGSLIERKRVHSQQGDFLDKFRDARTETKAKFRRKLQPYLAEPHAFKVNVVESRGQPLALIIYSRQNQDILEIPVLRVVQGSLTSTLFRHLIHDAILISAKENRILTKITESHLSDNVVDALQEDSFVAINRVWVKANLQDVEKADTLEPKLVALGKQFPQLDSYFQHLSSVLESARSQNNIQALLQVERSLWPAKIADLDIPTYIVSIWPQWAKDLFDHNIAKQTLWGADPSLVLNVENVYYRSSRTKLASPARILWYVSQRTGDFQGTMSIRACSYLDQVIVDKPKALYSRFKRLGVYKWEDVYSVAGKDVDQEIMAFRFSGTELFNSPIHRDKLQEIWMREKGQKFNILSPIRVSNDTFLHLYKMGTQVQCKGG